MKMSTLNRLLMGVSLAAVAGVAHAQQPADAGQVEEVVVTGSRVITNGFNAPTPVTTVSQQALIEAAPSNIPDALNQLPQFSGSRSPQTSATWNAASPQQGNFLNLRGLGSTRSIVLLDGVRVPPTSFDGAVDTNTIPQSLVSRVDVVTGGASAAYGSDAVVGAINFILDKTFTGVKGSAQGGISSRGDNENYRFSLAAGTPVFGGRGHIVASLDHYWSRGLPSIANSRSYGDPGGLWFWAGDGTAANPRYIVPNIHFGIATDGGKITAPGTQLNGLVFDKDGSARPMVRGEAINTTYEIGGEGSIWEGATLNSFLRTTQAFGRFQYDITDNVTFHAQAALSEARNRAHMSSPFHNPGITLFADNAFLRPDVRARLGSRTFFTMIRMSTDIPRRELWELTDTGNFNVGFDGRFGDSWRWDATYVYGTSRFYSTVGQELNNQRFFAALDAVVNPANGQIVCRTTLTNPGLYPGCTPLNLFGEGNYSQAALDYIHGESKYRVDNKMHILSANLAGDLMNLWAGPLSVAVGGEWRKQSMSQRGNGGGDVPIDVTGIPGAPANMTAWNQRNVGSAVGSQKVKEAYGEVNLPIARDLPMVQSFDLNGAARITDYATSGTVKTWKVGMSYTPFTDLRIRGTLSRDIAAPSLNQLFAGAQVSIQSTNDIHTNPPTVARHVQRIESNPALTPEIGRMAVLGAVYSPSWLEGFTVSVDAYQLLIENAIQNSGNPNQDCEDSGGIAEVCQNITRPFPFSNRTPDNIFTQIIQKPINVAKSYQAGMDVEIGYRFPADKLVPGMNGNFDFRLLATHLSSVESKSSPRVEFSTQNVGYGNNIKWRGQIQTAYRNGPLNIRVNNRFTGSSKRSRTQFYLPEWKRAPNRVYTDLNISYAFLADQRLEAFVNIQNLFDTKYPIQGVTVNPGLVVNVDKGMYDIIGTFITAGMRFRM